MFEESRAELTMEEKCEASAAGYAGYEVEELEKQVMMFDFS